MSKITVKQNPETEVPTEVLADSIVCPVAINALAADVRAVSESLDLAT